MRRATPIDQLVKKAKNGDQWAFGELYDALLGRVYRFVFFRVSTREDAEDITEQIFVRVFEKIGEYHERGVPFEAWVFRISRNMIIDYYRAHARTSASLDEAREMEDKRPSPEEATVTALTYDDVRQAMKKLPDAYQEIIILKFIEERDNDEISEILEKPVDQIRVLQSRALARLKQLVNV